jgi:hypothetical protein
LREKGRGRDSSTLPGQNADEVTLAARSGAARPSCSATHSAPAWRISSVIAIMAMPELGRPPTRLAILCDAQMTEKQVGATFRLYQNQRFPRPSARRGRRGSEERAEASDGADVTLLRPRCELAERHVFIRRLRGLMGVSVMGVPELGLNTNPQTARHVPLLGCCSPRARACATLYRESGFVLRP